jgi:hypothetical protein
MVDPVVSPHAVTAYEYQVHYTGGREAHDPEVVTRMNELGADGWRLVAADGAHLYFEREVPAEPPP